MRIAALVLVGLTLASCASGGSASTSGPTPGVLSGVVDGHPSSGGSPTPLANAQVGVYRQAVSSGGPIQQDAPAPVATATTNSDGAFTFRGLATGKWFVLAMNQAGSGTWVRFDAATGAAVTLVVCTDCPIPMVRSLGGPLVPVASEG